MFSETLAAIGLGAELVGKVRQGRASEAQLQQLAVRYWSCVLFEVAANLRDICTALAHERASVGPILRFAVFDAIIGDLCRLDPTPSTISELNDVVSNLKTIEDMYEIEMARARTPRDIPFVAGGRDAFAALDWVRQARQYEGELFRIYLALRDLLSDAGRRAYKDAEWQTLEPTIVPPDREAITAGLAQ